MEEPEQLLPPTPVCHVLSKGNHVSSRSASIRTDDDVTSPLKLNPRPFTLTDAVAGLVQNVIDPVGSVPGSFKAPVPVAQM